MTDYIQRVKDCRRRAAAIYPHLLEVRRRYQRLDKVWSYWMNRAYEAEMHTVEVNVVDSKLTRKKIKEFKEKRAKKLLQTLTPEQKKDLLRALTRKGETK